MGDRPDHVVATDRVHGRHLHAQPGHRARSRGRLLRDPLPAAAHLRARRVDRLRVRPVQRQPDHRGPQHRALDRRSGADPADGEQHHPAHAQRGPRRRWSLRRHLHRLRPRPVVRLSGAQRLRRHDHDHVRPRRPPRHPPHPRPVVPALRARDDHRGGDDPPRRRRADVDREVAAGAGRVPQPGLLAHRARARHPVPGHALPRLRPGADGLALQPPRGRVHDVLLGVRLGPAALRPRRYGAGLDLDLRPAGCADRGAAVALPALDRRADRRGPERGLRPDLAAEGAHLGPSRTAEAAEAGERPSLAQLPGARRSRGRGARPRRTTPPDNPVRAARVASYIAVMPEALP